MKTKLKRFFVFATYYDFDFDKDFFASPGFKYLEFGYDRGISFGILYQGKKPTKAELKSALDTAGLDFEDEGADFWDSNFNLEKRIIKFDRCLNAVAKKVRKSK